MLRELRDGGRLEDRAERDLDLERLARAGDDLDGQERVAPEIVEAVVHADVIALEHVGPDGGEHLFHGRARRSASALLPLPRAAAAAASAASAASARRSTLPFGVSGSASIRVKAAGIM